MTEKVYQEYGKDFIATFKEFWPKKVKLVIYWEGDELRPDEDNITWRYIEEVAGYMEWMDAIGKFAFMNGKTFKGYNIQRDARHVRKALIEMHALNTYGGKVFWADADIIFHSQVPEDFLDQILPDDKFSCFCGREGWMYSETGFIGFNANHPLYGQFVTSYREFFTSGAIFTCQGWHDCYGFDFVRKLFDKEYFVNLSGHVPYGTLHPVINSVLGSVMDHQKGPRKGKGSTKADLIIERNEPYWQNVRAS